MVKVSRRAKEVPASATMAVASRAKELKAQGVDVVSFGAGEPDFDTPEHIKQAAVKALKDGKTGYTPTPGIPELREAVADKLKRDNDLEYEPTQVIINVGAKHSIYSTMQAIVDPGDEILLPAPYWVTYPEAIKLAGGKPVAIAGQEENQHKVSAEQIKAAITDKTAALLLNSPNNPGGFTYTPEELRKIAEVLEGTDITVISDEIYEKLVYGDTEFMSFAAVSNDALERTVTINGWSKAYAMTGWRLGFTAGPQDIISAMGRIQSHMTQNPVSFVQYAGIAAFDCADEVEKMRSEFEKRAEYTYNRLNGIYGVHCDRPTGAFYCFPDVSSFYGKKIGGEIINGSMDFAKGLLEQANVAMVPGGPFGCDKNIRLSFACSMENIEKGIDRLEQWLTS
ncbi:Aspartate aminotransferase [Sedimentisphaera cyanobacteriorum]|uniref:Aspartate aminotransferase n=1 Tax=Sedimentisphaera cyanobacteriorum TaxID=1940790 RepID=A0A1Q2HPS0_9BACT|nr:pyridoxal phosphate-dependent aminotransferase [Sedimentisphaera cyanobacteriorum]AQQ09462.1 Aspartate aminotransferase [Sedimentisphaera cyanobacteriorum]